METKKTAVYVRVSTEKQSCETQICRLTDFLKSKGTTNYELYQDEAESGASEDRPALKRLLTDVIEGKVEFVLVTKLDRLFRSLKHLIETLAFFKQHNTTFMALDDNIDLTTPQGVLMMQLLGAFAEFERNLIAKRTHEGMQKKIAEGKKFGAPKVISSDLRKSILMANQMGMSLRKIASKIGVSHTTIKKTLGENAINEIVAKELIGFEYKPYKS